MATVQIGTKVVGSIVKLKVNTVLRDFIVVHQGKPSALYDESCNGTWLLMKDCYEDDRFDDGSVYDYANSTIHASLNSTFLNLFESSIRSAIKQVKIPYRPGSFGNTVSSGANGLSTKVFLLSCYEIGYTISESGSMVEDGTKLSYFSPGNTANSKRIAYLNGNRAQWWTRSPMTGSNVYAWYVTADLGNITNDYCNYVKGIRPAIVLPSTLLVNDSGTVMANTAPTAPTALALPASIRGGISFAISWSGATDAQGNLQGYYLERSINGGTTWAQIYQGSAANTTDIIQFGATSSVMYRVKAYDTEGLQSAWYTSASKPVVNNAAPIAPQGITVPLAVVGGESLTVTWSAGYDSDANLSGYRLQRSTDRGTTWTQVYQGTALTFVDSITKGWATVQYRVLAYDSYNEVSAYATSPQRTVDNNSAPSITCAASGDLGEKAAAFSITYSVDDADGDVVTVAEKMDGVTLRSFPATLAQEYTFDVTADRFMQLLNGSHTMQIVATDEHGKSTTLALTFTKAVYACSITLSPPFTADALVTKMVMSIARSIPEGAAFQILVSNNPFDDVPAWEDATQNVKNGMNYLFSNTTVTATDEQGNAKHGFGFKITAARQELSEDVWGDGGFIASIGGAFE